MEGFEVLQAEDLTTAQKKLEANTVDIVLCDVKLPDGNALEFVREIKTRWPLVEIILLTAYGNIPDSVVAIKNGAFDYLTKGDDNNRIIPLLYRAVEKIALNKKVKQLEKQLGNPLAFQNMVAHSPAIQKALVLARKVAQTETTVLLTGETGTGKEIFARAIHEESARSKMHFVAINCAAYSRELLEAELFGHKAGAFTGAVKDHKGVLEEANGGTLFLDEIGEMAVELQAKLLRVLETGEFYKIGESKPTKINVRIIAATNRDLRQAISRGHFREDLFYRLSVFDIPLPALRERKEDIPYLVEFFVQLFSAKTKKRIDSISPELMAILSNMPWKGNIRELKNAIERCVILAENNVLTADLLPAELQKNTVVSEGLTESQKMELSYVEKIHIIKILHQTEGNKTKTAELLGIALTTLYRKLSEYKIG